MPLSDTSLGDPLHWGYPQASRHKDSRTVAMAMVIWNMKFK